MWQLTIKKGYSIIKVSEAKGISLKKMRFESHVVSLTCAYVQAVL